MYSDLYPPVEPSRIDYDLMNREHPKLKAKLTRARNSGDPLKVAEAVKAATDVWKQVGCWPDDWPLWRNAIEDAWEDFRRSDAYDDDLFDNGGVVARRLREAALPFARI
jgi:hypothetical protein